MEDATDALLGELAELCRLPHAKAYFDKEDSMIRTASRLFLCAFVLATAVYADAATTFYGTTSGQPVFDRPDDLSTLSSTSTRYSVQPFFPNDAADCFIESVQEGGFDGYIFLYRDGFDPANPLVNLVALSDDAGYGVGSSRIDSLALSFFDDYYLVTAGYNDDDVGTFTSQIVCDDPATRVLAGDDLFGSDSDSDYDGRIAELLGGRFQVSVIGTDFSDLPFIGRTVPMASTESAIFWFFEPANFELLIKMVNGCGTPLDHFWVFYAAATNVQFAVTVHDTLAGLTKTYTNPSGSLLQTAVTDIEAFPCP